MIVIWFAHSYDFSHFSISMEVLRISRVCQTLLFTGLQEYWFRILHSFFSRDLIIFRELHRLSQDVLRSHNSWSEIGASFFNCYGWVWSAVNSMLLGKSTWAHILSFWLEIISNSLNLRKSLTKRAFSTRCRFWVTVSTILNYWRNDGHFSDCSRAHFAVLSFWRI